MTESKTTPKQNLLQAIKEFLDYENCAAFHGHIENNLYVYIGSKENIAKLIKHTD